MPELASSTQKLMEKYRSSLNQKVDLDNSSVIHVDEIAKKVASFYDKIRGIIDWKGEHLLRRNAIERTLRRKTLPKVSILKNEKKEVDAKSLVLELIRAGHLPNDTIKESKIEEVQHSLDKYVYILNNLPTKNNNDYKTAIYQWLTSIAACEVEEILNPSRVEKFLLDYMFEQMKERIKLEDGAKEIDKRTKETLIFIATQRALFGLDEPIITYHLFKHNYSNWNKLPQKDLRAITNKIYKIREKINRYFTHELEAKFYQLCKKQSTPYLLIGDILKENKEETGKMLSAPEALEKKIKSVYKKRVSTLKARLSRSATYSTISIFITNVAALYLLEIPLAKIINWQANTRWTWEIFGLDYPISAILGTILIPTIIMAAFVLTVSSPPKENLHKVIIETMNVVYKKEKVNHLKVKEHRKRGFISNILINFVWVLSTIFSLGLIVKGLSFLNFPPLSYLIFIIFLSLIGFAGTKIRERSRELHMLNEKEGLTSVILDIFALPMIRIGKWFTNKWKKYNIISVFFSALVDLPFMSFVRFLEQWRGFLKEKREDIY